MCIFSNYCYTMVVGDYCALAIVTVVTVRLSGGSATTAARTPYK